MTEVQMRLSHPIRLSSKMEAQCHLASLPIRSSSQVMSNQARRLAHFRNNKVMKRIIMAMELVLLIPLMMKIAPN